MTKPHRVCLFCGLPLHKRSREHVLPEWLQNHLGISDFPLTPTHTTPRGVVVNRRAHPVSELVAGRVCEDCNSGWMSRLEVAAMPVLKPLMDGQRTPEQLDEAERRVVGRWTLKTAYALNDSSNYPWKVPPAHALQVRNEADPFPLDVIMTAQVHEPDQPFDWAQGSLWVASTDLRGVGDLRRNSYKFSFQLRRLLLLASWWSSPGWVPHLRPGVHVAIWPGRDEVWWIDEPVRSLAGKKSRDALASFHGGLTLVEPEA
jgi:hypothetical protein